MKRCTLILSVFLFAVWSGSAFAAPIPIYLNDSEWYVDQNTIVLDGNDTGGDISIQFGDTLAEYINWIATGGDGTGWFQLTDALQLVSNETGVTSGVGLTIENSGTGDSLVQFLLTGVRRWVVGIDNSDDDKFKIAYDQDLGTNAALTIDTSGNVGIGNSAPGVALDVTGTIQQSNAYLYMYKSAIQDLGTVWTDITWDNEVRKDSLYTHAASSAVVSVGSDGWYLVTAECSADLGSGTSRSHATWRLVLDQGGGYAEVPGTIGGTYHRTVNDDEATMSITRMLDLDSGDLIKLQGFDNGNDVQTMANGCRFMMERK